MAKPIHDCHVVAVPYPGRGHVNPMMNLCKQLPSKIRVTFVVTEEWLSILESDPKPPSHIRYATIPNVLPSELNRAADMPTFVGATQTKMTQPFEHLLDQIEEPVGFILADTFLSWAVDVGIKRNIAVASLWPMPASVFAVFYHFDLIEKNGHYPFDVSERGEERIDYIPGIQSIRLADIPSIAHMKDQRLLQLARRIFRNVPKAQYLLFTNADELEPQAVESLKREFPFPVYTLGPTIPFADVDGGADEINSHHHDYFEWLNAQPTRSVLYVSLGSFLSVSSAQMDEIAVGLRESGVRFLWVARGESARLQEVCVGGGSNGRVVPWSRQLKVLNHGSIGGFWTHCGWNSTMEAIYCGVPIIAFPIIMDQVTIRKHIVEDWKIGVDAKRGLREGELLRSGEIAEIVREFMDLESEGRREITRRSEELKAETVRAVAEGGSSKTNLRRFVEEIVKSCGGKNSRAPK